MERTDLPGEALDRAADPRAELRLADGARVRLCRRRGAGRVLHGVGDRSLRWRAVGHLFALRDRRHRRTAARPQRLRLRVGRAEEPRLGRRGGRARRRRLAVPRGRDRSACRSSCRRLLFAAVLVFFLGFELFGLPLVLGDPEGHLVLSTYLYKLTNKLGTPSYHLMAAVAICIVAVTFPLVLLQRYLLQNARKYATIKGKAGRMRELPLRRWKWVAAALIGLWLFVGVIVPLSGVALRAFVSNWGYGAKLAEVFTFEHFLVGVGRAYPSARDLEHDPDRHRRRRDRGRVLHGDRLRDASAQRRLVALRRLPRAGPARDTGTARRTRVPVGVPVLPAADSRFARRSSACGSPTPSCGSPTECGSSRRRCCRCRPSSRRRRASAGATRGMVSRQITLPLIRPGCSRRGCSCS